MQALHEAQLACRMEQLLHSGAMSIQFWEMKIWYRSQDKALNDVQTRFQALSNAFFGDECGGKVLVLQGDGRFLFINDEKLCALEDLILAQYEQSQDIA